MSEPQAPNSGTRPAGRSALAAIVGYTVRACVPTRRSLLLLPFAGAVLFGLLSRTSDGSAVYGFVDVAGSTMHLLILPITCLVLGDALLGAEIRSGVFAFTWLSPVRYSTIIVGRWLGGCAIAIAILVPAVVVGAVVAGALSAAGPAVVAASSAGPPTWPCSSPSGRCSSGPSSGRWPSSLSSSTSSARRWRASPSDARLAGPGGSRRAHGPGGKPAAGGHPHGWAAVGRLAVVAAVGLAIATRRLRRLRPGSAAD